MGKTAGNSDVVPRIFPFAVDNRLRHDDLAADQHDITLGGDDDDVTVLQVYISELTIMADHHRAHGFD